MKHQEIKQESKKLKLLLDSSLVADLLTPILYDAFWSNNVLLETKDQLDQVLNNSLLKFTIIRPAKSTAPAAIEKSGPKLQDQALLNATKHYKQYVDILAHLEKIEFLPQMPDKVAKQLLQILAELSLNPQELSEQHLSALAKYFIDKITNTKFKDIHKEMSTAALLILNQLHEVVSTYVRDSKINSKSKDMLLVVMSIPTVKGIVNTGKLIDFVKDVYQTPAIKEEIKKNFEYFYQNIEELDHKHSMDERLLTVGYNTGEGNMSTIKPDNNTTITRDFAYLRDEVDSAKQSGLTAEKIFGLMLKSFESGDRLVELVYVLDYLLKSSELDIKYLNELLPLTQKNFVNGAAPLCNTLIQLCLENKHQGIITNLLKDISLKDVFVHLAHFQSSSIKTILAHYLKQYSTEEIGKILANTISDDSNISYYKKSQILAILGNLSSSAEMIEQSLAYLQKAEFGSVQNSKTLADGLVEKQFKHKIDANKAKLLLHGVTFAIKSKDAERLSKFLEVIKQNDSLIQQLESEISNYIPKGAYNILKCTLDIMQQLEVLSTSIPKEKYDTIKSELDKQYSNSLEQIANISRKEINQLKQDCNHSGSNKELFALIETTLNNPKLENHKQGCVFLEYYDRLSSLKNLQEILKKHVTELLGSDWEQGKLSFNQITENKVEAESYTKEFEQSVKIELENVSKSSTTNTDNFYHLGQFAGKDYYGSLKLPEKIDKITAKRLENALKKGFANHAFGNNGVKVIEHNHQTEGFELKIKGDTRAYSNKVYKYQEKAFIQFDKLGNHTDVEKFFSNHHIETAVLSNDDLIKLCGVNYENQFIE